MCVFVCYQISWKVVFIHRQQTTFTCPELLSLTDVYDVDLIGIPINKLFFRLARMQFSLFLMNSQASNNFNIVFLSVSLQIFHRIGHCKEKIFYISSLSKRWWVFAWEIIYNIFFFFVFFACDFVCIHLLVAMSKRTNERKNENKSTK